MDEFYANCLYDLTPDQDIIVAFAVGLSGHGYKMSNIVGDILVDLVTKKSTSYDISFFSLKRFMNA